MWFKHKLLSVCFVLMLVTAGSAVAGGKKDAESVPPDSAVQVISVQPVERILKPNVIIGTILYQGIVSMTPSVMNSLIHTDMSEVLRIIVSNGMILYALTRKSGASR